MMPETTPRNTQQQKHALAEPDATKTLQSQIHDVVHAGKPPVRWSARRRRDAWFLLLILLLGIVTIFALSNGAATVKQRANIAQLGTPPATTTSGTPTPPARVLVRTAQKRLYPFPSSNVGLMQPAVDAHVASSTIPGARARIQGLYSAAGLLGGFAGASGCSFLYGLNFRLPLFAIAVLFGICVLVGGIIVRISESRNLVPPGPGKQNAQVEAKSMPIA